MKQMFVFGTRPEAIKMAPLVREFQKYPDFFQVVVCVTGQHREMLDQVLEIFKIKPQYDLDIMKKNQDLYDVTTGVLLGMRDVFNSVKPDVVFVHGDTLTSTATALASFFQRIPVAHVEAGLRTNNIYSPWPEEMNRQLTGRVATFHFAPTELAKQNLLKENVKEDQITVTGNTVIDALHLVLNEISADENTPITLKRIIANSGYDIDRLREAKKMILITGHRRENFGEGFINICTALKDLAVNYPEVDFVYPVHLNPNVQKTVYELLHSSVNKNVFLLPPLDYLPFVFLMNLSYLILTDSGGIQEEAPSLGKPVLVMRDTTERPEALAAGTVKLVGADADRIFESVTELLESEDVYAQMSKATNPYGYGKSSEVIVNKFLQLLNT